MSTLILDVKLSWGLIGNFNRQKNSIIKQCVRFWIKSSVSLFIQNISYWAICVNIHPSVTMAILSSFSVAYKQWNYMVMGCLIFARITQILLGDRELSPWQHSLEHNLFMLGCSSCQLQVLMNWKLWSEMMSPEQVMPHVLFMDENKTQVLVCGYNYYRHKILLHCTCSKQQSKLKDMFFTFQ